MEYEKRQEVNMITEAICTLSLMKEIHFLGSAPRMKSTCPRCRVGAFRLSWMMLNQSSKAAHGPLSLLYTDLTLITDRRKIRLRSMRPCSYLRNQSVHEVTIESHPPTAGSIQYVVHSQYPRSASHVVFGSGKLP